MGLDDIIEILCWLALVVLAAYAVAVLAYAADAGALGTTSQWAFERCGETHLTVTNNTSVHVDVVMFGSYQHVAPEGTAVFWTDELVEVDRVTRRKPGQTYHDSATSVFAVEQRACTFVWATL